MKVAYSHFFLLPYASDSCGGFITTPWSAVHRDSTPWPFVLFCRIPVSSQLFLVLFSVCGLVGRQEHFKASARNERPCPSRYSLLWQTRLSKQRWLHFVMQQDMLHQLLLAQGRLRHLNMPLFLLVNPRWEPESHLRQVLTGDDNKPQKEKEEMFFSGYVG